MTEMTLQFTCHQVAGNDAAGFAVDHHQLQHFMAGMQGDVAQGHLPHERGISAQEQLLPGLSGGVKRALHLHPAERPVGQEPPVFTGERNTLCDTLIDDGRADLGQAVYVGFAGTVIAAFDCIVEKAEDYKRSSAADYYFGKQTGKVQVTFLDAMIKTV